jgi:regulator of cell morphogenesis and NO signaling
MLELSSETRVTELEAENPALLKTLKSTGIFRDGDDAEVTVGDLCMGVGLHPQIILNMLQRTQMNGAPADIDISELDGLSLVEIVEHIETVHHTTVRENLPVIVELVRRVASVHGDSDERLHKLQALFEKVAAELENHMLHEEEALFPMCRSMAESGEFKATRCGDRVGGPIQCMKNDHDQVKQELSQLSELTDAFTPPAGACNSYHEMLKQLKGFAQDTVLHIHKEDHLLFPRALETQAALRESN